MSREKTIKSLADSLHDVYDQVLQGKMDTKSATALTRVSNSIIDSAKVRLKYRSQKQITGEIKELE